MGKSNNIYNKFKKVEEKEQNLNDVLEEEHIKKIESINNIFIKKIATDFSKFIKYNIQVTSYKIKIGSNSNTEKLTHANLIKILPFNHQSLLVFSPNFFSVIIETLFGGNSNFIEKVKIKKEMTSTEKFINEKIMKLITECYSDVYKEFYSISFMDIKMIINFKTFYFDPNEVFLINFFNFNINNTEVFFNIFIPLFLIKKINKKEDFLEAQNQIVKKNVLNGIFLDDIYDVKLDIAVKLMSFSIYHAKLCSLSVGDIFSIDQPNKIIAYLEDKPIFYSKYKTFNEQSIIFIEEFIENNIESDKKRNTLMNNIEKKHDQKKSINSKKKIHKENNTNKNILSPENTKNDLEYNSNNIIEDNKKIVLDTLVNITVELGKSKIKIKDFLNLSKGSMLILDKLKEEPLDIFINGHLIALGEIVFLENKYGLRITDIKRAVKSMNFSV